MVDPTVRTLIVDVIPSPVLSVELMPSTGSESVELMPSPVLIELEAPSTLISA
jgi:hypothetical protein